VSGIDKDGCFCAYRRGHPGPKTYSSSSFILSDLFSRDELLTIKSLGKIRYVEGVLDLTGCDNLESLGDLKYVEKALILPNREFAVSWEDYIKERDDFIKSTKLEDYPLHLKHKDPLIRSVVKKALESGSIK